MLPMPVFGKRPGYTKPSHCYLEINHLSCFSSRPVAFKVLRRFIKCEAVSGEDKPPTKHGPAWRPPSAPPRVIPSGPGLVNIVTSPSLGDNNAAMPRASKQAAEQKAPFQQRVLNSILAVSNVPYSSFVPTPVTPLHRVDARIKQLWIVSLYLLIARSTPIVRLVIAFTIAAVTAFTLPPRLWRSQLIRLGLLCAVIFTFTALGSDGIPRVLQPRAFPDAMAGLPPPPSTGYSFVILHVWFITVTHRSLNLAVTAACLTFSSLQMASLCLITTPGEEMALALRWWLAPLRLLGAPLQEMSLTLLLSLRFMSLVFEEVRNLCLGLAARGVDWKAQGNGGSLDIAGRLLTRLFGNLGQRSNNIATAMVARGFVGPDDHQTYMMQVNRTSLFANVIALLMLAAFGTSIHLLK